MWTHLPYLLQVQIALTLLWLFYSLVLQRETRFGLSRAYLLLSVPVALLLPLLHIPVFPGPEIPVSLFQAAYSPLPVPESLAGDSGPDARSWLCGLALVGSLVLSAVALFHALSWLRLMSRRSPNVSRPENIRLVYTSRVETACSLFGWVFLNREHLAEREIAHVLQHEMAHVRLRHSWDRLLAEGARILLWWNPAVWMWYRSLVEVHEFQADRAVLETNDELEPYVQLLLRSGTQPYASLVSGFSYSLLRKRLKMIGTLHPGGWSRCKIALIVPLLGLLLGLFSFTRGEAVLVDDLVAGQNQTVSVSDDTPVLRNDELASDDRVVEPRQEDFSSKPDTLRGAKIFVTTARTQGRLVEREDRTAVFSASSATGASRDSARRRSDFFQAEDQPVAVIAGQRTDEPYLRESDGRRQAAEERARQAKQRNVKADVRRQEALFRESEANARQAEAQVRQQEADMRAAEVNVRENEAALRRQEAETRRQVVQMQARQAEISRQAAELRAQDAEVSGQEAAIRAQEAEIRRQAVETRRQAAAIREQEAQERLRQSNMPGQQARAREREATAISLVAQNRQQQIQAQPSEKAAASRAGKLGAVVVIDGKSVDPDQLMHLPNTNVASIRVMKKEKDSPEMIVVTTKAAAERAGKSSPQRRPNASDRSTHNERVQIPNVGKNPIVVVDSVQVGMDYLETAVPESIASILVIKNGKDNADAKILITTKKAAGVVEPSGKPN